MPDPTLSPLATVLQAASAAMKHRRLSEPVTADTLFADDLEREETAMAVEDDLGIKVGDTEMRAWACPGDVVAFVEGRVTCG